MTFTARDLLLDPVFQPGGIYQVPLLDHALQGFESDLQTVVQQGRSIPLSTVAYTRSYYTDDFRLWSIPKKPGKVLDDQLLVASFELNYSILPHMPFPAVLYLVYRKRWFSCLLQSRGVRIFVDLNACKEYRHVNMHGVPPGWLSFSTRGYANDVNALYEQYVFACDWCRVRPVFAVWGGGSLIQQICEEEHWCYIPDPMNRVKRKKVPHG